MRVLSLAFVAGLALAVSANPVEDASTELSLEPIEPVAALEPLSVDEVDAAEEEVDSVEEDDLVARDVEAAEEEDLEAVEKRDVEEDVEEVVEKRDVEEAVEEAVEKRDVEEDLTAVEERDVEAVEEDGEEELDFDEVPVEWAHPATDLAARGFAIGARSLNETSIDLDELVKRDHKVVVKNKCKGKTIQPIYHAVDGSTKKLAKLKYGKSTSMVVPEKKHAWRMFGQTCKCSCVLLPFSRLFLHFADARPPQVPRRQQVPPPRVQL